jgi:hypothetical protein
MVKQYAQSGDKVTQHVVTQQHDPSLLMVVLGVSYSVFI